jgi:hypothetical protein
VRRGWVAAVVCGAAAVAVVTVRQIGADQGGGLSLPHTLDHGRYTLVRDTSDSAAHAAWTRSGAMHGMTPVAGSYRRAEPSGGRALLDFDGGSGTVRDRGGAVRAMLGYTEQSDGDTVAVTPATVRPAGSSGPLTCEVVLDRNVGAHPVYLPVCAWADGSTVGVVSGVDYASPAPAAADVDVRAFAALTATVRQEVGAG